MADTTFRIPLSKPSITELEKKYLNQAIDSGYISSIGEYVSLFEREFANFCGTKYALTVSNGTTGLHLSLAALGIGQGDEVIVPDLTFVATANAVKHAGAEPVFADIDPITLCIDAKHVSSLITPRTKAIIPVHLYGMPADMEALNEIADKHHLKVIEDAAESHGASIHGKMVGSFGTCGVFSFYGNKILTTGEGGMITTDDYSLVTRLKQLRDHAMSDKKRYWHTDIGFNYRMTNMQAAIGLAQVERAAELLAKRKEIYDRYCAKLGDISRIKLNCKPSQDIVNVYWMICMQLDGMTESSRDQLMSALQQKGIDSRPYFYPVSDMPMYQLANTPITHGMYQTGINLPTFYDITNEEIDYVCMTIKDILGV